MASPAPDPVTAPLLELLSLFDGPLKNVRFPDVDHASLVELAGGVRACTEDVERAEAALLVAKTALDERRESLLRMCQRALAYARVYAEEDPALRAQLEAIPIPRMRLPGKPSAARSPEIAANEAAVAPAPRKRGRPPKDKTQAPPPEAIIEKDSAASEPEETLAAE